MNAPLVLASLLLVGAEPASPPAPKGAAEKDAVVQPAPSDAAPAPQPGGWDAVQPEDDDEDLGAAGTRGKDGAMDALSFRDRYLPLWFPEDLHAQLEEMKWKFILGGMFVPTSTFWSPYFMVTPTPRLDFTELLRTTIYRSFIQLAGHVIITGGYMLLGITCPPGLGFYLWLLPMYVASLTWVVVGTWQTYLSMLVTWDASLKDQRVPQKAEADAPRKPRRGGVSARPAKAPLVADAPQHGVDAVPAGG